MDFARIAEAAGAVVSEIRPAGGEVISISGNISYDSDCCRVAAAAINRWSRVEALVNAAGTAHFIEATDAEDFQQVYAVNTIVAFQTARAAAGAIFTVSREHASAMPTVAASSPALSIGSRCPLRRCASLPAL